MGFPSGSDGKESVCNVGNLGSIPGLGRSPGEGNAYLFQYSCLENSMARALAGYSPWGWGGSTPGLPGSSDDKESACNVGNLGSIPRFGRSPGEGNGYPFQYPGLENPKDSTVHGVAKSWT